MFFTQEDYRKIEKWLLANSVKDTEFAGASLPLKGNETVAFVQDGKNVNVFLKDLIEQRMFLRSCCLLLIHSVMNYYQELLTPTLKNVKPTTNLNGDIITLNMTFSDRGISGNIGGMT